MIVLAFLLTLIIYLSFPTAYVIMKGKVSKKKATKMAIINSVVCAVIFEAIALALLADDPSYTPNFLPAIFYYGIARAILKEKDTPDVLK